MMKKKRKRKKGDTGEEEGNVRKTEEGKRTLTQEDASTTRLSRGSERRGGPCRQRVPARENEEEERREKEREEEIEREGGREYHRKKEPRK